jgi:ankyrin repeat protein
MNISDDRVPPDSRLTGAMSGAVDAVKEGDLNALNRLLDAHPELARLRSVDGRTLLHHAADWPGHFPNGAAVVAALIASGANPNAPGPGRFPETPLHWAASSDDVEVLDALNDGGADLEAPGACIAGGTPLDDAVAFGQWRAARRLVESGARVGKLWHASALGMMAGVEEFFAGPDRPAPEAVNDAFWQACHGGQREAAEYLLNRGADLNWIPAWTKETPLDIARSSGAEELVEWLSQRGTGPLTAR